ncbi:uncharacterized protein EV422DRAFT_622954 [Fimicolochytrium jonesii]|uniref:uncharacterized protein n=1 Tax=Fimicolochytrium jonesii TaxID=1396493 RepID=UPI0022FE3CB0|nr:uncharacterized protein EV422DRAFT_622954 [Fimicolochytrium jonesii]KAI8817079.1 hypothetical protein EV422DRAFT_622954 [Fimicolochytrium jonesii]
MRVQTRHFAKTTRRGSDSSSSSQDMASIPVPSKSRAAGGRRQSVPAVRPHLRHFIANQPTHTRTQSSTTIASTLSISSSGSDSSVKSIDSKTSRNSKSSRNPLTAQHLRTKRQMRSRTMNNKPSRICTEELLRKHIAASTSFGRQLEQYVAQNLPVPDDLVVAVLQSAVRKLVITGEATRSGGGIVLEGFPRTPRQAKLFEQYVGETMTDKKGLAIYFDVHLEDLAVGADPVDSLVGGLLRSCPVSEIDFTSSLAALDDDHAFGTTLLTQEMEDARPTVVADGTKPIKPKSSAKAQLRRLFALALEKAQLKSAQADRDRTPIRRRSMQHDKLKV